MPKSFTVILYHIFWQQIEASTAHSVVCKAKADFDKTVIEPLRQFAGDKRLTENLFSEVGVLL